MEPFNLKEYFKNPSVKIVTRDGKPARIICTNKQNKKYPVVALVMEDSVEGTFNFTEDGLVIAGDITKYDLFFIPERKEGWMIIYAANDNHMPYPDTTIYKTKEEALKAKRYTGYMGIAHVEWE